MCSRRTQQRSSCRRHRGQSTASSTKALLAALPLSSATLAKVPGITTEIAVAVEKAFQQSYVIWLRTTALSLLSFGIIGIISELKILDFLSLLPCVRSWLENEIF